MPTKYGAIVPAATHDEDLDFLNTYFTKVNKADGVNALKDIAEKKQTEAWSWKGTTYAKNTKGARPHKGSLNVHSEVLRELIRLAPTTRLSRYSLRDILFQLHIQTGIFDGIARERSLQLHEVATAAADRWCIMLRHCLVLCRLGGALDEEKGLDECIKLIDADEHWKIWPLRSAKPTSSAADTAFPPGPPVLKRAVGPPYEPWCKYLGSGECSCKVCRPRPAKRPRVETGKGETAYEARLRLATEEPFVSGAAEEMPYGGTADKCSQTEPDLLAPCGTEPDLPRKKANTSRAAKGKKEWAPPDSHIEPPFYLRNRDTDGKERCSMHGTVGGCVNLVVTSISFAQSRYYEDIMDQILQEAKSGLFKNKSDAVRKRDKLIEDKLSEAA